MFHILTKKKKIKLIMPICIEGISKSPELKKRVAFSIFCPVCVGVTDIKSVSPHRGRERYLTVTTCF